MNRRLLLTAMPIAAGLCVGPALVHAQQAPRPMVIYSGEKAGTYYRLMEELGQFCPVQFENKESEGSLANIERVMNNQAELSIAQLDALVLLARREANLREQISVLAVLHPEEVHLITKSAPHWVWTSGYPRRVVFNELNDLKGSNVGFWGGTGVTENIIAGFLAIGWNPVELPDQVSALAALRRGEIDAVMAVGGQPLDWVSQLNRDYKLLEITETIASRLSTVYEKTTLSYRNLGQHGVPALSIRAMLVTRNYDSSGMRDRLQGFRNCLWKKIPEIRETRDTHRKWLEIEPMATTDKWPMYPPPNLKGPIKTITAKP